MPSRRYVVLGLGAVGGGIAGRLRLAGCDVIGIARGAQLTALQGGPLHIDLPSRSDTVELTVVDRPAAVRFEDRDVVLLCTKTQHVVRALAELRAAAPAGQPIVCAQNGVAAERMAAGTFDSVYGMVVFAPASYLEPGRVALHSEPVLGVLDVGRHPVGTDALVDDVVRDLQRAGFEAHAEPRILRLKYGKLLTNVVNVLQALGGQPALSLRGGIQEEAIACYRAAKIEHAPLEEMSERYRDIRDLPVRGHARGGGSTWQSLARGASSIETEYLNGEIVRLGETVGFDAPRNRALVTLAKRAVEERWPPARMPLAELEAALHRGPP